MAYQVNVGKPGRARYLRVKGGRGRNLRIERWRKDVGGK